MALQETIIYDIQVRASQAIKQEEEVTKRLIRARQALKELNAETRKSKQVDEAAERQKENLKKQITELRKEQRDLRKEIKLSEEATRSEEGSFKQLSATSRLLTRQYNQLGREKRSTSQEAKNLTKRLTSVNAEMRELKQEVGDGRLNVGRYAESLGTLDFTMSGLIKRFASLKAALISSGVGAAAVALGTLVNESGRLIARTNEIRAEVGRSTGLRGADLAEVTGQLVGIVDILNVDYQQALTSSLNLAARFNLEQAESLELIATGLEGLTEDQAQEFLAIVEEYPEIFRQAGVSAGEFVSIANQQIRAGFFSDKGVDSIKEATLAIRELPQVTRDALSNIGIDADNLQRRIESGQITLFEAVQEVARVTAKAGEDSQAYGQILADVFKGAGEDAGEYLRVLGQLDTSYEVLLNQQNEATKSQRELREATTRLNTAFAELTGETADDIRELKVLLVEFAADAVEGIIELVRAYRELKGAIEDFDTILSLNLGVVKDLKDESTLLAETWEWVRTIMVNINNPGKIMVDTFNRIKEAIFGVNEAVSESPIFEFDQRTVPGQAQADGTRGTFVPIDDLPQANTGAGTESGAGDSDVDELSITRERIDEVKGLELDQTSFRLEQDQIRKVSAIDAELQITAAKMRALEIEKEIESQRTSIIKENLQLISFVSGTLAGILKKDTFAQKLAASAQASINTYLAATKALDGPPGPPFSFGIAAATIATGLANVAKINGISFFDGGETGNGLGITDGQGREVAGFVHANELVFSERSLRIPQVAHLTSLAAKIGNLPGFFDGGMTTNIPSTVTSALDLERAQSDFSQIRQEREIFVSITELRRFDQRVNLTEDVGKL